MQHTVLFGDELGRACLGLYGISTDSSRYHAVGEHVKGRFVRDINGLCQHAKGWQQTKTHKQCSIA